MRRTIVTVGCALAVSACAGSGGKSKPLAEAAAPKKVEVKASARQDFEAAVVPLRSQKTRDWPEVESAMRSLTKAHPGYGPAWYNLGVAQAAQGRPQEAQASYRKALALDGDLVEAKENLAAMAVQRGDRAEAMLLLEELADHPRVGPKTQVALARNYLAQGEVGRAESLAERALGRDPKNMGAYCVLAKAALKKRKIGRAGLVAAQGLKLGKSACLNQVQGELAQRGRDTAAALVAYQRAVDLDPKLTEVRFRLAQISLGFKDFKRAEDNYKAITSYAPDNGPAWINLGVTYKAQAKFAEAEKAYLQAAKLTDPEVKKAAAYDLGVLYLRHLDKIAQAEAQLKAYLKDNGDKRRTARRMLKEIQQRKKFAAQAKKMEAEAQRQAEAEAKAAKAGGAAAQAAPAAQTTPEVEPKPKPKPKAKKKRKKRRARRRRAPKPAPSQPVIPKEDDFE